MTWAACQGNGNRPNQSESFPHRSFFLTLKRADGSYRQSIAGRRNPEFQNGLSFFQSSGQPSRARLVGRTDDHAVAADSTLRIHAITEIRDRKSVVCDQFMKRRLIEVRRRRELQLEVKVGERWHPHFDRAEHREYAEC